MIKEMLQIILISSARLLHLYQVPRLGEAQLCRPLLENEKMMEVHKDLRRPTSRVTN